MLWLWMVGLVAQAAAPVEARLFTDLQVHTGSVDPFVRFENRYRDIDGQVQLYHLKSSVGARTKLPAGFSAALFLAEVDQVGKGSTKLLYTGDLWARHHFEVLDLGLRVRNEWQAGPDFDRLRVLGEAGAKLNSTARAWLKEEVRFDSDEQRMVMDDVVTGVTWKLKGKGSVQLRYDLELSRRGSDTWSAVHAPGALFATRW